MSGVFVSYPRRREEIVQSLIEDVKGLGHSVWYDKELTGGKPWWDGILSQIQNCDVFVLAVSPETLESKACMSEWSYAADLGKTVLPVFITREVTPDSLPERLRNIQSIDYCGEVREVMRTLGRTMSTLPPSPPLPHPLPALPEVPPISKAESRTASATLAKTAAPDLTWTRRVKIAAVFALVGEIGAVACITILRDPAVAIGLYEASLVVAAPGAWLLGFATVGRIKELIWPVILGAVVALVFTVLSFGSWQSALSVGLVFFQPLAWVVAITLRAIARKLVSA